VLSRPEVEDPCLLSPQARQDFTVQICPGPEGLPVNVFVAEQTHSAALLLRLDLGVAQIEEHPEQVCDVVSPPARRGVVEVDEAAWLPLRLAIGLVGRQDVFQGARSLWQTVSASPASGVPARAS
jgi:hypothetical protein